MLNIAQDQGIEQDTYRALLSSIVTGLDYGSNDLEPIKKHLRSMAATLVEWQSPTSGEGSRWSVCALIAHAELKKEKGQIWVEWSYAKPLKQELLEPSVFAKLSISILSQLHTHAGVVLYEICTRYKVIGRTSRQNWRWWQPVLSGQPFNEKLAKVEYRFFKRDTLKPAIAEVCAITDLEIELVEYKDGKFISDLQFIVRVKSQAPLPLHTPPKPVDVSLVQCGLKLGVPDERIEDLAATFGEDAVKAALVSLEKRSASQFPEPLRDPSRYLKSILAGDKNKALQASPTAEMIDVQVKVDQKIKEKNNRAAWNDEWIKHRRNQIIEMLHDLSVDAIKNLETQLSDHLTETKAHPSIIKRLNISGWQHPMVRHLMVDFYARANIGENWSTATSDDLLAVASRSS